MFVKLVVFPCFSVKILPYSVHTNNQEELDIKHTISCILNVELKINKTNNLMKSDKVLELSCIA